jgi:hypothetical protein
MTSPHDDPSLHDLLEAVTRLRQEVELLRTERAGASDGAPRPRRAGDLLRCAQSAATAAPILASFSAGTNVLHLRFPIGHTSDSKWCR